MKTVTMFYLESCPYCKKGRDAIAELTAENPEYAKIPIEMIEESEEPERADAYDYYRVPSLFIGEEKLYEADIFQDYEEIRDNIRRVFDLALA